jgi:hypothetical protein
MDRRFNITASPINDHAMTNRLKQWSKEFGSVVHRLGDIFAVHLLLADYEIRIKKDSPAANMTREEFLEYVITTSFSFSTGVPVPNGRTIGVHHSALQLHCLLVILDSGKRSVYYHKGPMDDPDNFVVGNLVPNGDGYHEGFVLNDRAEDKVVLNQALGKVTYEVFDGRTYVPSEYPMPEPLKSSKPWNQRSWASKNQF